MNAFDIHGALVRAAGAEFSYEVLSVLPWKRRELVAASFGSGRVFIAGDAAHQMSPTGGLGMNTGIGDAVDIGWKLAALLQGWGGPQLLESYAIERKPVAASSVAASSDTYIYETSLPKNTAIAASNANGERARRQFAAALSGRRGAGNERLHETVKLNYCYENSPIIWPDETTAPLRTSGELAATCRSGARAPHAWINDGLSTLDLFGDGFVLLRFDRNQDATPFVDAAVARRVPLRVVDIAGADIGALYERKLVLVRPDGHVAWRGDNRTNDAGLIVDRVRGIKASGT